MGKVTEIEEVTGDGVISFGTKYTKRIPTSETNGGARVPAPGTLRPRVAAPACRGDSPDVQARDTIRSPNAPRGAATVTVSPACPPMSARPIGEMLLMRPSAGEASWLPTIV